MPRGSWDEGGGSGRACGLSCRTGRRQGLHPQAKKDHPPLLGIPTLPAFCFVAFSFSFFNRRGLAPAFPSIPLRTGRLQRRCGWLLPPPSSLPAITAGNSEVLSPLESGSGWAGLWPDNHRASELKHHLSDGSWDASAGRIVPGKEEPPVSGGERDGRGLFQRSPVVFCHL